VTRYTRTVAASDIRSRLTGAASVFFGAHAASPPFSVGAARNNQPMTDRERTVLGIAGQRWKLAA